MGDYDITVVAVLAIIVLAIIIAVSIWLLRLTFRIKRQLWNQEQQIFILLRIAEKLGVDKGELIDIEESFEKGDEYL